MPTIKKYYIPQKSNRVIITTAKDEIIISIVYPETSKIIDATYISDYGSVFNFSTTIQIPQLCFSHLIKENKYSIHFYKDSLFAPYLLANVYDYGTVCYGDTLFQFKDLRQAWNYYWGSSFNQENSKYYDYHRDRCLGAISHDYAGHREEESCICACCIEICNCVCACNHSVLFKDYLESYPLSEPIYKKNPQIENTDSLIFKPISNQLLIIPPQYNTPLRLNSNKNIDNFACVISETDSIIKVLLNQQETDIPKEWLDNGNP
ncbi:hypothetical protein C4588_05700 [Candidatus Parcubacteria bacterium]|nr:MAG: hypothetical protein C4588_05700 [Candidatus Parcubacteria bacterium]